MSASRTNGDKFTAKQGIAILALLAGSNLEDSVKTCCISVATLRRWRKEPGFVTRHAEARDELQEFAINRLSTINMDAVAALHRVVADRDSGAAATVSAARTILELQFKAKEILDLTKRLSRLEAMNGDDR